MNTKRVVASAALALASLNLFALTPTDLATLGTRSYNYGWNGNIRIYKDLAYSTRDDLSTEGAGFTGTSNNGKHRSGTYFDVYVHSSHFISVDKRAKMPVFLFLHGGAWCQPYDKDVACQGILECAANKGYFVITMDYQLQENSIDGGATSPRANATFGHMLKDVDTMLAYLKVELPKLNIPTNMIVIGGESAGGHLAMCYAFDQSAPRLPGMSDVGLPALSHPLPISCVMSDVGPTDLSEGGLVDQVWGIMGSFIPQLRGMKLLMGWLCGQDFSNMSKDNAAAYIRKWNPTDLISASSVPAILAYGCTTNAQGQAQSDDSMVPVSNFIGLTNRLASCGVPYSAKLYVGVDHGSVAWNAQEWIADRLYDFKTNHFNVTIPAVDKGPSVSYGTLDASAFSKKVDVTFGGYSGTTTLTNFPVLVKLSTSINGFKYSDFRQSNGGDLRFMASNGKLLPHEIDTWNPSGVSTVWVKVPYLTGTATKITACYGCANPPTVNPKDVWDSNYVGVWHLGESALPLNESSKRSRDFSAAIGTGIGYASTGIVGGAVNFGATGKGRMLDAADNTYLDGFTNCTIEAWTYLTARPTSGDKNVAFLTKRNATNKEYSYCFFDDGSATKVRVGVGTNMVDSGVSIASVSSNSWTHQVFTFNAGSTESYKNGANKKTGTSTATKLYAGAADLHLGNFQMGDARNFPGKIDEVRISRSVRSADWVKATYETVTKSNFATYAIGETQPVEPDRILYVDVDGVATTNDLDAALVTENITNIVKQGAGTLVASAIPNYTGDFTLEGGVFSVGIKNGAGKDKYANTIYVGPGASLQFSGTANNIMDGKKLVFEGAAASNAPGGGKFFNTGTWVTIGTNMTFTLKSDTKISCACWNRLIVKNAVVDMQGHDLSLASAPGNQIEFSSTTFRNPGNIVALGSMAFVQASGHSVFEAPGAGAGEIRLMNNASYNGYGTVSASAWKIVATNSGAKVVSNSNRFPGDSVNAMWNGSIDFGKNGSAAFVNFNGGSGSTKVSNTVFNVKGPLSGSGKLTVGPGWLNLHTSDNNTYSGAVVVRGQTVYGSSAIDYPILPGGGGIGSPRVHGLDGVLRPEGEVHRA